jgi:hypothetical protein
MKHKEGLILFAVSFDTSVRVSPTALPTLRIKGKLRNLRKRSNKLIVPDLFDKFLQVSKTYGFYLPINVISFLLFVFVFRPHRFSFERIFKLFCLSVCLPFSMREATREKFLNFRRSIMS